MRIGLIRPTILATIAFSLLYWLNNQNAEAAVVFVAGALSSWILILIMFYFDKVKHENIFRRRKLITK